MATILVVEDEEAMRYVIAKILQLTGHEVITASNGLEAIALFRSSPERFDVILTDLQMPLMNGYQLVNLVRETSANMKIISMCAYRIEPIPANTEFLQKPFQPDALRACVSKLLNRP